MFFSRKHLRNGKKFVILRCPSAKALASCIIVRWVVNGQVGQATWGVLLATLIFLFFSHEHEPIHVHVRGHNGDAKFVWDGEGFVMEYSNNIKANDLKRIERAVHENADIIINRWFEIFKPKDDEDQ